MNPESNNLNSHRFSKFVYQLTLRNTVLTYVLGTISNNFWNMKQRKVRNKLNATDLIMKRKQKKQNNSDKLNTKAEHHGCVLCGWHQPWRCQVRSTLWGPDHECCLTWKHNHRHSMVQTTNPQISIIISCGRTRSWSICNNQRVCPMWMFAFSGDQDTEGSAGLSLPPQDLLSWYIGHTVADCGGWGQRSHGVRWNSTRRVVP